MLIRSWTYSTCMVRTFDTCAKCEWNRPRINLVDLVDVSSVCSCCSELSCWYVILMSCLLKKCTSSSQVGLLNLLTGKLYLYGWLINLQGKHNTNSMYLLTNKGISINDSHEWNLIDVRWNIPLRRLAETCHRVWCAMEIPPSAVNALYLAIVSANILQIIIRLIVKQRFEVSSSEKWSPCVVSVLCLSKAILFLWFTDAPTKHRPYGPIWSLFYQWTFLLNIMITKTNTNQ